jgi:YD repeat-containing protein
VRQKLENAAIKKVEFREGGALTEKQKKTILRDQPKGVGFLNFSNPEGGVTTYVYDSLNRFTTLTDFAGSAFNFSYDVLGRRTNLPRPNGVSTAYSYDNLSRLLAIVHQGAAFTAATTYSYDPVGNRTSRTDTLQQMGQEPVQAVTLYSYDALYQLTQAVLNGTTTETYSYDAVGNRLSSLGVPSYAYNNSNQLTATSKASYTYDANGNTRNKTEANGTTS